MTMYAQRQGSITAGGAFVYYAGGGGSHLDPTAPVCSAEGSKQLRPVSTIAQEAANRSVDAILRNHPNQDRDLLAALLARIEENQAFIAQWLSTRA